jgi:hypothetical protein
MPLSLNRKRQFLISPSKGDPTELGQREFENGEMRGRGSRRGNKMSNGTKMEKQRTCLGRSSKFNLVPTMCFWVKEEIRWKDK